MEGKQWLIFIHTLSFDVDDGPKTIEDSKLSSEESYSSRGPNHRFDVPSSERDVETPEEKIYQNYLAVARWWRPITGNDLCIWSRNSLYARYSENWKLTIPTLGWNQLCLWSSLVWQRPTRRFISFRGLALRSDSVVAHIERYHCLKRMKTGVELIRMGCYTQINSSEWLKPKLFAKFINIVPNISWQGFGPFLRAICARRSAPSIHGKGLLVDWKCYGSNRARAALYWKSSITG